MQAEEIGQVDGRAVHRLRIASGAGLTAEVMTYGARLTSLRVPDRDGVPGEVVLGYDDLAGHVASPAYAGATCGRVGNRIAGGAFRLEGVDHALDRNEGANHLHGGSAGFDRKIWGIEAATDGSVTLTAGSADGEMGYPGHCAMRVTYRLEGQSLLIAMTATADRATPVNMVHHSYFNLAGGGDVLGHLLQIDAAFYTPVDAALLATGAILPVAGTAFDFTREKPIGRDLLAASPDGYDHNWVLGAATGGMRPCARLRDPVSGRVMRVTTTEPGVQVYAGGHLAEGGRGMRRFAGVTFETQKFPGSPNHAHFPDCILRPGQVYDHRMALTFTTDAA
jgi:aldose 1-epimerase